MEFAVKRVICAVLAILMLLSFVGCAQDVPERTAPVTEIVTEPATVQMTEAPTEPAPAHAQGCGAYLLTSNYPMEFGPAQYSAEEIRAMKDYSAEELQAAISTLADMIQYIIENNYGDNSRTEGDLKFKSGGYLWSVNKSPQGALLSQSESCGAFSNLTRYVLEDDYDEEGYIGWIAPDASGHVFNYFVQDGIVLPFDFKLLKMDHLQLKGFTCLDSINAIAEYVLRIEYGDMYSIFVERDVHRDCAPRGSESNEGLVSFLDYSVRDEIELLYLNKDARIWSSGMFEDHPYFENIGVSNDIVPKELIDSADMTCFDGEVEAKPLPDEEVSDDPLIRGDCNIGTTIFQNHFNYDLDNNGVEEEYIFGIGLVGEQNTAPVNIDMITTVIGRGNFVSRTVFPCVWRVEEDGSFAVVNDFASRLTDVELKTQLVYGTCAEPVKEKALNIWPGCTRLTFEPIIITGCVWQYEFTAKLEDATLNATAITQIWPG